MNTPVGRLVVVSGPSGAGKTTVLSRVLAETPISLVRSISATTRAPRPDERSGVDYYFLTPEEFEAQQRRGAFLETFEVFGQWYGTPREAVESRLAEGLWVLLNIDVQGGRKVMAQHPDAVTIFLAPSCPEELERRLRLRRTESEEAIQRRLQQAQWELAQACHYRYRVANDDLDQAVREVLTILNRQYESDAHDRRTP